MQFLRQVLCNPQRNAKVLQRGLSGGSPASQNDTEEQPLQAVRPIMEIQHQEYLTFSKAAILMGCSRQYIYKLVAMGKLKASRISNRYGIHPQSRHRADAGGKSLPPHPAGSTSTPKKSASSSFPAKKKKGKREAMRFWTSIPVKR